MSKVVKLTFVTNESQDVEVPYNNLHRASINIGNTDATGQVDLYSSPDGGTTWFPLRDENRALMSFVAGLKQRYHVNGYASMLRATVTGLTTSLTVCIRMPNHG